MRLIPKSKLYGQPTLHVRDFLRHVGPDTFDEKYLQARLQISSPEAKDVVTGLLADQYIDHALPKDGIPTYGLVAKGRQFAAASFAPQIARIEGERLLAGVIARAEDSESQRPFVFQITKIALFGSMLGSGPFVSDVDLALAVKPRYQGREFDELNQGRIDLAEQSGKRFKSMIASVVWPRMEITEFLRGGSRHISLHSFTEMELLQCPFRFVYEHTG